MEYCSSCDIAYDRKYCPLCDAENELKEKEDEIQRLVDEVKDLEDELKVRGEQD